MKFLKENHFKESLNYHMYEKPGKLSIIPTKNLNTQYDLSLAYSPGVAAPCLEIKKDVNNAYKYTNKGNLIAVITNGTAVLGLGNLGAIASKPVMEGKAVLFKKFADIDAIDIEIDTIDPDEFINVVKLSSCSWGGINLEDIKSPECFYIEKKLKEILTIPVFHDDQHGTAIIATAGLINAVQLVNKNLNTIKIVINGAGAAALSCIDMFLELGVAKQNVIFCDTQGVVYQGRTEKMNPWKEKYATNTNFRSLEEALLGADVFIGLSVAGAVTKNMVKKMSNNPIIFAMANPDPEITPEEINDVRNDAIIATGRSDYANQINNVMAFPYIFRGALDTRSNSINKEMKLAASFALAKLAKQNNIPESVYHAYPNKNFRFSKDYIIPVPFDSRLLYYVSYAVAEAAIKSKVATKLDFDLEEYKNILISKNL